MEIWDGIWDKLGEKRRISRTQKQAGVNMKHSREGWVLQRQDRETRKGQEGRESLLLIQLGHRRQLKQMIREFRVWPESRAESEVKISIEGEPVGREEHLSLLLHSRCRHRTANTRTWKGCARQVRCWALTFLPALAYFLSCKYTLNKLSLVLLLAVCLCLIFVVVVLGTQNSGNPRGCQLESGIRQQ